MRDCNIPAIYLSVNENLEVVASEIDIDEVFNTTIENSKLSFDFETKYDIYQNFAFDDI